MFWQRGHSARTGRASALGWLPWIVLLLVGGQAWPTAAQLTPSPVLRALQNAPPPDAEPGSELRIRLVTFGSGAQVHQYFGHDALMVEDRRTGRSTLYNYGMFSFGPTMLANFLRGRLTFWVAEMPVAPTFRFYRQSGRSILVQDLDLSPAARLKVAQKLAHNVLPENRDYLYHHYYDNCATRLRDVIDMAVDGQLEAALDRPSHLTYRGHTRRYAQHDPFIDVGLQFMMNDQMEKPITLWEEAFLPAELARLIGDFEYTTPDGEPRKLVSRARRIYDGEYPSAPKWPYTQWPWTAFIGLCVGGVAWLLGFGRGRAARVGFGLWHLLVGLAFGIPGLLGGLTWAFTEHSVTYRNENMLQANVLTFLLWPLGLALAFGSSRARRWAQRLCQVMLAGALLGVLLKVVPAFDQVNYVIMTLSIPTYAGLVLGHRAASRSASAPASASQAGDAVPGATPEG